MIVEPIRQYRFRLAGAGKHIANQVSDVKFDNKNNTISINVRATIEPDQMHAALDFAINQFWHLEIMGHSGNHSLYGLKPYNMTLVEHTFSFDYAVSEPVMHHYVFSYDSLSILYANVEIDDAGELAEDTSTDEFPSVAKAMAKFYDENKMTSGDKNSKEV